MMTLSLVGLFVFFGALLSTFLLRSHRLLEARRHRLLSDGRRLQSDLQTVSSQLQGLRPIAVIEDEISDAPDVDELFENVIEESKRKQRKIARDMAKRQRRIERELAE